ncbi:TPA: EF-P beta-lysylation protein EpmB [Legionella pneumophila subsp. pneumophila]|uniref:L-lysine 2,3-aminomutase n=1 Tax=Legionella pneumophila (strain Lens) TaxID=297245 RepID=Q5WZP0_LEGPL|nr:EF-P beta-lysylation protein EpmB [Legionella pneumophila]AOW52980.1 EF-P beta-lysylation protein EpmB [Legionella pneumophila subsp. pneumophila]AOW56118.1 EF-P beta-lysylation protein EpmB [Legionella pneumophila subsp. pneumophila]AOW58290.1 EF-P beta-lysylation protein EpmB [Legionella pneumophila subsp. pneumophila]AOW61527.1 EF-P beta-lysylation protein EpmB [Legionella pneumophila subsp. pneumophila]AOW63780.1 EF-P beta-lysylation protein EpmB [Legionella pneumophila subsp. pneumophi
MRDTSLSWQKILAQGFTSTTDLLDFLELPRSEGNLFAEKQFPSRIPLGFAKRMQKGNPKDPLLLQVLAKEDELTEADDYVIDPLSENNTLIKGLLHKYRGRVLLTLTGVCAVNCRYCFRRHFPYQANNPGRRGWKEVCAYIANDPSITEVILSGGDPLLAANLVLEELLQSLEEISHIHTLRIHTRIPIVLPERIDKGLLDLLTNTRFKKVIVIHCNHPQELDESVLRACSDLKKAACYLLNQSVLLAGINDDAGILSKLSHALFDYGIMPYYLHLLDKVKGSAHFDMPLPRARSIYHQLQSLVPGYLLPRLAREEPGRSSKTLLI